jgi:hypothetical protein
LSVRIKLMLSAGSIILFLSVCSASRAQTSANCGNPPGGRISCESRQAAICRVTSTGQVLGVCTTPQHSGSLLEIGAEVLSMIFRRSIGVDDIRKDKGYQKILRERSLRSGGERITFRLPGDTGRSTDRGFPWLEDESPSKPGKDMGQPLSPPSTPNKPGSINPKPQVSAEPPNQPPTLK